MGHEQRLNQQISQWTVQALTRLLATFAILQGVGIVLGGPTRWVGPAFALALSVPGAPATWGITLGALGAVALAGTFSARHSLTGLACVAIGAWSLFFAGSFLITAQCSSTAATTGIFAYGHLCVLACTLGVAYWKSAP